MTSGGLQFDQEIGNLIDQIKDLQERLNQIERHAVTTAATETSVNVNTLLSVGVAAAATSITVNRVPVGGKADGYWVVIDPWTTECEIRKVTAVSGTSLTVAALTYAHSANDGIIFITEPTVNVKWFGAKGDDSTDDSTAIQRAVNAVSSDGWQIIVPDGVYILGTTITGSSPVKFIGEGRTVSVFKRTTNGNHFTFSNTNHISFKDIGIFGNYPTLTTGSGLSFTTVDDIEIIDCRFEDISNVGVNYLGCNRVTLERNYFYNLGNAGIRFGNQTDRYVWIRGNYLNFANGEETGGHAAIQIQGSGTHEFFWIEENYVENPGTVGIGADLLRYGWIQNNYVKGNGTFGECISLTGAYLTVKGNKVTNAGSSGIIYFATTANYSHANIIENFCWANTTSGISLVWGQDNVTMRYINVHGNICVSNVRGIQSFPGDGGWTTAWQDITIWFNILYNNSTSALALIHGADVTLFANKGVANDIDLTSRPYVDHASYSTINGFSSSTKNIYYKSTGSTVKIKFRITGNSDGTVVNFTLPYASKSGFWLFQTIVIMNASTRGYGHIKIDDASGTVHCYPDAAESAWTASGVREIAGQFEYEATINP